MGREGCINKAVHPAEQRPEQSPEPSGEAAFRKSQPVSGSWSSGPAYFRTGPKEDLGYQKQECGVGGCREEILECENVVCEEMLETDKSS